MVNALNSWVALLITICTQVIGFDAFKKLYLNDSSFEQIYVELMDEEKRDNFICKWLSIMWFVALYPKLLFMGAYHP